MSRFSELLLVSVLSVGRVFAICALGVLMSIYPRGRPVFTKDVMSHVSYALYHVFNPALIVVKVASGLDSSTIGDFWPIIVWSALQIMISYGFGAAIARVLGFRRRIRAPFLVACCFNNAVALPLILLDTICKDLNDLKGDPKCYDKAVAILFLFTLPWHLTIWSAGEATLLSAETTTVRPARSRGARLREFAGHMLNPPLAALYFGIVIGLVPGLKDAFFAEGSAFPLVFQTLTLASEPALCLMNLIMAASLALAIFADKAQPVHPRRGDASPAGPQGAERGGCEPEGTLPRPSPVAVAKPSAGADAARCDDAEEKDWAPGDGSLPRPGAAPARLLPPAAQRRQDTVRLTVAVSLVRLVLVPSACLGLFMLAERVPPLQWLVPDVPLVRVTALLLSCVPSAQLVLMLTSKLGLFDVNSLLSVAYVVMYLVSIATITGWLSLFLAVVFG